MITSIDGQSPYIALIGTARTPVQKEVALAPPETSTDQTGTSTETEGEGEFSLFGEDGFTFGDLIDVVNPLQHIPVVSTMYREASEDSIAAAPRVLGSTLFFGPVGLATAVVNVMIEESTGKDIGEHMVSAFFPDEETVNDTRIADISSFETAAGTQNAAAEDIDPVSAWAAGEMAWIKSQQAIKSEVSRSPAKSTIPDADRFLNGTHHQIQDELATLTPRAAADAARAASWAYESTANLALSGA